ncbi:ABC transporter permease [Stackebrandtia soli]|uniref:ABC transporter permease n=1 Tax=Stackebrandtia soli TaxID=1892856 RepID=UPI0039ED7F73
MSGTVHALEHWLFNYRRTWYGSVFSSFILPVLFLVSIGYSVGAYVDDTSSLGGVDYAAFVAPGLLASTGLQLIAGEMTWPVFAALRWGNQYKAMQASPLTPAQMVNGHLLYGLIRAVIALVVFTIVMALFGIFSTAWAPLVLLPAALTSASVIGLLYSFSISIETESALSVAHRFGVVPITLFSGVFFPLSQLPQYLQPIAWLSPLWHGAELCRLIVSGTPTSWWWGWHAAYLVALTVLGWWLAHRCLTRRLTV